MSREHRNLSGLDAKSSKWLLRVYGSVGFSGSISLPPHWTDFFKPGPTVKALLFEIKNLENGATAMFTFSGGGLGRLFLKTASRMG
jgi:hypothetical protein